MIHTCYLVLLLGRECKLLLLTPLTDCCHCSYYGSGGKKKAEVGALVESYSTFISV